MSTAQEHTQSATESWTGAVVAQSPAGEALDYRIDDLPSFQSATMKQYAIAGLYFFQQMDCVIRLVQEIAGDFFNRPHMYVDLDSSDAPPPHIPAILARLSVRSGHDEHFLSDSQRDMGFTALFGAGGDPTAGETGDFPRLRDALFDSSAAFAERVFDTGVEMLRERVRTTVRPFREYIAGLQGDSLQTSHSLLTTISDSCYSIARARGVCAVFGIDRPPPSQWPYTEDANGDKLIEVASTQLGNGPTAMAAVTRQQFSTRQRAGLRGAEALATIISTSDSASGSGIDRLITKCYTWRAALLSLSQP